MVYHSGNGWAGAENGGGQPFVIDVQFGDVTGDGAIDAVYLTGEQPYGPESAFVTNIAMYIQDGRSGRWTKIVPKENAGYEPAVFLGDFTGNMVDEIHLSIFTGGSGGYTFYYIYSLLHEKTVVIFDHEVFNQTTTENFDVVFQDGYKVKVSGWDKTYIIDLTYKGEDYLSEIYDEDGRLKKPINGWVNPLGGLYPVDFKRQGVYGLYAVQRLAGRYNADGIGYLQTSLEWDAERFSPFMQTVGIYG